MPTAARAVLIASARSENANSTSSGSMWASPKRPDTGRVDDPAAEFSSGSATDCDEVCAAPCRRRRPHLIAPIRFGHKAIHQRGLPDAGVAEQHRHLVDQQRCNDVERVVATGGCDGQVEIGELRRERLRRREVGLGQAQNRRQPAGVGGDQRRVRQGRCAVAGRRARPRSAAGRRWRRRRARSGSVSSAVRRNTVRRSPRRHDARHACLCVRTRSPTRPTSSPTTIERPAQFPCAHGGHHGGWGHGRAHSPSRPRSTVTTMPSWRRRHGRGASWSAVASPDPV